MMNLFSIARNILVANDDLVKISDFGLARFTDNDNCYTFRTDRKLPIKWYDIIDLIFFMKYTICE